MAKDMKTSKEVRPDTLTQQIGVLTRREVEARILSPIIDALSERFGRDEVIEIIRETIVKIAQQQGHELAESMGANGSEAFMGSLEHWKRDGALELDVLEQNEGHLDFNVTRCRYAEMYRELGIPELGSVLSCNRDFALIRGFNKDAKLKRTQTIMDGASHCDFRFAFRTEKENP
jgi:predicted ArsR family transcriptional regulator